MRRWQLEVAAGWVEELGTETEMQMTFWKVVKEKGKLASWISWRKKKNRATPHILMLSLLPVTKHLMGTLKEEGLLWMTEHSPVSWWRAGEGLDSLTSPGKWAGQTDINPMPLMACFLQRAPTHKGCPDCLKGATSWGTHEPLADISRSNPHTCGQMLPTLPRAGSCLWL